MDPLSRLNPSQIFAQSPGISPRPWLLAYASRALRPFICVCRLMLASRGLDGGDVQANRGGIGRQSGREDDEEEGLCRRIDRQDREEDSGAAALAWVRRARRLAGLG